jgi:hypothetical protein
MAPFNRLARVAAAGILGLGLASCSEYLDRRDGLSVQSGNAVETNKVAQMVDPWPRSSRSRNIAFNGAVIGSAVERYRTGRVIPPNDTSTSGVFQGTQQGGSSGSAANSQPTAPPPPLK